MLVEVLLDCRRYVVDSLALCASYALFVKFGYASLLVLIPILLFSGVFAMFCSAHFLLHLIFVQNRQFSPAALNS
jgi:hypothetical protein